MSLLKLSVKLLLLLSLGMVSTFTSLIYSLHNIAVTIQVYAVVLQPLNSTSSTITVCSHILFNPGCSLALSQFQF